MCDTIVALGNSTADGSVIFGKNSDREPNEAHEVVIIPAASHAPGSRVKCTYVEIPQVPQTYRVLLAKPFWIWGAEMGSNEHGVTIGNEAVFTRTLYQKAPGLIGMDFLRLALERSRSTAAALDVIIELLEQYGQGGNCGFAHSMYYHNSFLICDPEEAWVLETSGRDWAAEKVRDVRSISNAITIGETWDRASETLITNAIKNGWCKKGEQFSFSRCYSDTLYTTFSDARRRQTCTSQGLFDAKGKITAATMMNMLRSHSGDSDPDWSPARGITGADVCMHAGWGPVRGSQTAGSMVSVLAKGKEPLHWVTGTASPCISIFKPVWVDAGVPEFPKPDGTYDAAVYFWRHEALHRAVLKDYSLRSKVITSDLGHVQEDLCQKAGEKWESDVESRYAVTRDAFRAADEVESRWHLTIKNMPVSRKNGLLYASAWKKFNKEAKMPIEG